jgi:hypothetical protein
MNLENIKSTQELGNFLIREAHNTQELFDQIEGFPSYWRDIMHYGNEFPTGSGFASKVTCLQLPGMRENPGNDWYRLLHIAHNEQPVCLESLFADAPNLSEIVRQTFVKMKFITHDIFDDFCRMNFAALSKNRWPSEKWDFVKDSDGNPDVTRIVVKGHPGEFQELTIKGMVKDVRKFGEFYGTFPDKGNVPIITDEDTFLEVGQFPADERFYVLQKDEYPLRYNWDDEVKQLVRVHHSDLEKFLKADFQISFLLAKSPVFEIQSGMGPRTKENWLQGVWRFVNEVNEVTPCNVDKNKGFFRLVLKQAARPKEAGFRGHAILHRRFFK